MSMTMRVPPVLNSDCNTNEHSCSAPEDIFTGAPSPNSTTAFARSTHRYNRILWAYIRNVQPSWLVLYVSALVTYRPNQLITTNQFEHTHTGVVYAVSAPGSSAQPVRSELN
ncbi:LOW QUALITY PROTEIN: hypothetical protein CVT26_000103 [Gymnopilus dilepis]|uniref:Uncharacterized protein n=1 Tax=Gymnopilus dilepis TaxID=231916 RepID=A0A409VGT2_9AGAR|nr:LOW QUALITY PROTEIN: hypothetical protein CVT26_000103 [Gymnopilus dilepis]